VGILWAFGGRGGSANLAHPCREATSRSRIR